MKTTKKKEDDMSRTADMAEFFIAVGNLAVAGLLIFIVGL